MSPLDAFNALGEARAPRVSGDEPGERLQRLRLNRCSPRERG